MIPKIETINGLNTIDIEDFTKIDNVPEGVPFNPFTSFAEFILDGGELPYFDDKRNIITNIYSDYIFLEYTDKEIIEKDIENNKKIQKTSIIKSEPIDEIRQLAENVGEFEYNGKYYLALCPLNALTDELNPEKGIFKGVIVDSDKYFEVNKQVKETVQEVKKIL